MSQRSRGDVKVIATLLIMLTSVGCVQANFAAAATISLAVTENAIAPQQCMVLAHEDFSKTPDAVTQVLESHLEESAGGTPAYCEVSGYVAPSIRFRLRLPSRTWNGKLIELGCGGTCGSTEHISGCSDPLRRGYACIVSDGGNSSSGEDVKWAYNNAQAVIEYIVRASHVTAIVGKAIAERYYERRPRKSYFIGCSAGGMQAMTEAQRFPWDFDGIVAGDPDLSMSEDWMNFSWANRALVSPDGEPVLSQKDLETLHEAVVAKCDLNDGVKDGVIGDPRLCKFRPEELSCAAHQRRGCFTATQIDAIRKIYSGPVTTTGTAIAARHVFMGTELSWLGWFGGSGRNPTPMYAYVQEWFRYYLFQPNPGPSWTTKQLDFDHDYKRFGIAGLTEPVNPDLRQLKSANAKLILYTGWNDAAAGVGRTIDYYESAERVMGGRADTEEFFRLFVVPGMNHCTTGDGAFAIDYLSYLNAWVEDGKAPDKLIGYHVELGDLIDRLKHGDKDALITFQRRLEFPLDPATVKFSRPVYPYPIETRYMGRGDPNEEKNFAPSEP